MSVNLSNGLTDSDPAQITEQKITVFEDDADLPNYDEDEDANEDYSYPNDIDDYFRCLTNVESQEEKNTADQQPGAPQNGTGVVESELPVLYYDEEIEQFCEYFISTRLARFWSSEAGKYVQWYWEPEDTPQNLLRVLRANAEIESELNNAGGVFEHEHEHEEMGEGETINTADEDEDVADKEIKLLF